MNAPNSVTIYTERIHQTVDYISGHLSDEIDLEKLAAVACFSPFHFHRIFSALLGETPHNYIERLRMERAANEIATKRNLNLYEIAYGCGFNTKSSFSRAFKKYHGVAPSQFLQRHEADFHSQNVMGSRKPPQNRRSDFDAVEIMRLPSFHVAYTQTLEGYETGIAKAWNELFIQMHRKGLQPCEGPLIGIPYDNPGITPGEKCRYRACINVPREVVLSRGGLKTADLEEALYAVYHFKGTREEVADAYSFIFGEWLIQSNYLPDEKPLIELYPATLLSDCSQNRLQYDIALPIVKMP